jgi:hypothetical protein
MTKKPPEFEIDAKWQSAPEGRIFEVRAVEKGTKKVIARVTCHAPKDEGDDLRLFWGDEGIKAIEKSAKETCDLLARGLPE